CACRAAGKACILLPAPSSQTACARPTGCRTTLPAAARNCCQPAAGQTLRCKAAARGRERFAQWVALLAWAPNATGYQLAAYPQLRWGAVQWAGAPAGRPEL